MNKENDLPNKDEWFNRLGNIAQTADLKTRYQQLETLHRETLNSYSNIISSISSEEARRKGSDGRTIAVIVAHIMAWEEWQIQVFSDPDFLNRLSLQINLQHYYDIENNKYLDFKSVDDFNAYQEEKYRFWSWEEIQKKTIDTALHLKSFFPKNPSEGWIDTLEKTPLKEWGVLPKQKVPAGWYLWMVSLKHEAIEHLTDLVQ